MFLIVICSLPGHVLQVYSQNFWLKASPQPGGGGRGTVLSQGITFERLQYIADCVENSKHWSNILHCIVGMYKRPPSPYICNHATPFNGPLIESIYKEHRCINISIIATLENLLEDYIRWNIPPWPDLRSQISIWQLQKHKYCFHAAWLKLRNLSPVHATHKVQSYGIDCKQFRYRKAKVRLTQDKGARQPCYAWRLLRSVMALNHRCSVSSRP